MDQRTMLPAISAVCRQVLGWNLDLAAERTSLGIHTIRRYEKREGRRNPHPATEKTLAAAYRSAGLSFEIAPDLSWTLRVPAEIARKREAGRTGALDMPVESPIDLHQAQYLNMDAVEIDRITASGKPWTKARDPLSGNSFEAEGVMSDGQMRAVVALANRAFYAGRLYGRKEMAGDISSRFRQIMQLVGITT